MIKNRAIARFQKKLTADALFELNGAAGVDRDF